MTQTQSYSTKCSTKYKWTYQVEDATEKMMVNFTEAQDVDVVVINDEKRTEENEDSIPLWASVVVIVLVSIAIFMIIPEQQSIAAGLIFLFIILSLGGVLLQKKIIFDKGIKSIIVERRTIANKKIEWKENKRIKFSDIKEINVIEHHEFDAMGEDYRYYITELIFDEMPAIRLPSESKSESAKELATKLCKTTGAKGYYIDENKKSTPLIEAT